MPQIGEIEAVLVTVMMAVFGLVFLFIALRRKLAGVFLWMERRGWVTYSGGDAATYGTLANSLLRLQAISDPRQQFVLEAKTKESREEEGEGGPDKAGRKRRRRRRR